MESLEKKIGFLKGLLEGSDGKEAETPRILAGILDILSDVVDKNAALDEMFAELNDYVESIDDDLTDLESAQGSRGDYDDYAEPFPAPAEPFRLVPTAPAEDELSGCVCPACRFIFFIDGPDGDEYVCPNCEAAVVPEKLTQDNLPLARKAD